MHIIQNLYPNDRATDFSKGEDMTMLFPLIRSYT